MNTDNEALKLAEIRNDGEVSMEQPQTTNEDAGGQSHLE